MSRSPVFENGVTSEEIKKRAEKLAADLSLEFGQADAMVLLEGALAAIIVNHSKTDRALGIGGVELVSSSIALLVELNQNALRSRQ